MTGKARVVLENGTVVSYMTATSTDVDGPLREFIDALTSVSKCQP